MKNLLEDQLQKESDYYKIGEEFQKTRLKKNIKAGKKIISWIRRIRRNWRITKYFYNKTNWSKQNVFDKVIKQVPITDRKKFKINYDKTNNITIQEEERNDWRKWKKTWRKKFASPKFI